MTSVVGLPEADLAGMRTLIRTLREHGRRGGVIALAAVPQWRGQDQVTIDGQSVRVRVAPSVLAVRDAITERAQVDWLVVLTDREPAELPAGILEHLVRGRLLNLDPWPPLRELFGASRQEFRLLDLSNDAARAALRELDGHAIPAPGGVLTNDHLFANFADVRFGLRPADYTPHHVALWSMDEDKTARFEAWRQYADPALLDQFYQWISGRLGALGPALTIVWRGSGPAQLVPLGLVAALVGDNTGQADSFVVDREVVIQVRTRMESEFGGQRLTEQQLTAWGNTAALAVAGTDVPAGVLRRAEELVRRLQAQPLVSRSDVLPSALAPRIARYATALTAAIDSADLTAAENTWADVTAHRAARTDTPDAPRDVRVGAAALRLLRWHRRSTQPPNSLAAWLGHYRAELSWVDGAVNDAFIGADSAQLAAAAHRITALVREHRASDDREFARLLASAGTYRSSGADAPLYIEDILDRVVKPLTVARKGASDVAASEPAASPVLLIVADGMSAAAANGVVADALRKNRPQWQECRFADDQQLGAALAILPTVTEFSRCSLFTGAPAAGKQDRERREFSTWLQNHGLGSSDPALFHKAAMDAVARGHALADAVRAAVEDTKGRPVVACVLNDIDDALDRSDPLGASWGTSSFKHLDALLAAAAAVGRTVVLVSDHGHVVERREQPSVQRGEQVSARYRLAAGVDPAALPADEVLVEGPRVLTEGNRAVLAVDEQVRYTGLKAGYHGGAALAEATIPISILVNGAIPAHLGLAASPARQPAWWAPAPIEAVPAPAPAPQPAKPRPKAPAKQAAQAEGLFDVGLPAAESAVPVIADGERDRVDELLDSGLFTHQHKEYGRNFGRATVKNLVQELIAGNGRLPLVRVAEILGVKARRAGPAIAVLAQVFNTDGVVVLSAGDSEVELETALMFEQFGVRP